MTKSRILFFALLLAPALAAAEPLRLHVLHGTSRLGLTRAEVRRVLAPAFSQIAEETGATVRVSSFRSRPMRPGRPLSFSGGGPYVAYPHGDRRPVLVIAPPLVTRPGMSANDAFIAGEAETCGSVAVAAVTRKDRFVGHELDHARVAITHELGHLLGADHDESEPTSMMHPAPLQQLEALGFAVHFSQKSAAQIARCQMRRVSKRRGI